MPNNKTWWKTINKYIEPLALCHGLARELLKRNGACEHTGFPIVVDLLRYYTPDMPSYEVDAVIDALGQLGAKCDCEAADLCAER